MPAQSSRLSRAAATSQHTATPTMLLHRTISPAGLSMDGVPRSRARGAAPGLPGGADVSGACRAVHSHQVRSHSQELPLPLPATSFLKLAAVILLLSQRSTDAIAVTTAPRALTALLSAGLFMWPPAGLTGRPPPQLGSATSTLAASTAACTCTVGCCGKGCEYVC